MRVKRERLTCHVEAPDPGRSLVAITRAHVLHAEVTTLKVKEPARAAATESRGLPGHKLIVSVEPILLARQIQCSICGGGCGRQRHASTPRSRRVTSTSNKIGTGCGFAFFSALNGIDSAARAAAS